MLWVTQFLMSAPNIKTNTLAVALVHHVAFFSPHGIINPSKPWVFLPRHAIKIVAPAGCFGCFCFHTRIFKYSSPPSDFHTLRDGPFSQPLRKDSKPKERRAEFEMAAVLGPEPQRLLTSVLILAYMGCLKMMSTLNPPVYHHLS